MGIDSRRNNVSITNHAKKSSRKDLLRQIITSLQAIQGELVDLKKEVREMKRDIQTLKKGIVGDIYDEEDGDLPTLAENVATMKAGVATIKRGTVANRVDAPNQTADSIFDYVEETRQYVVDDAHSKGLVSFLIVGVI